METPVPRSRRPPPEKIGRYRVVSRIGKGAMGVVYSAYDDVMERSVAIKVMMADIQDDPETSTRFHREAHAAGQLIHRNIVTIFDLGEDDGRPFIVMELIEGQSLGDYLKRPEGVQLEDKIGLMLQVCDGLRVAHAKGIFHRDIKPGNLFVTSSGDLKVLDFGIARLASSSMTMSGLIMGTPDYMSPEQACGREVDQRSDIFSAGGVFYFMLTGRKPFAAPDLPAVLMKVQNEDPLPIRETEAPPSLAAAVMKALAKSPDARYHTTSELMTDLNRVTRELGLETARLTEQARQHHDSLGRLAAERQALGRELGVVHDAAGGDTFDGMVRQQYPNIATWLDAGRDDPPYRAVALELSSEVNAIRQLLEDEVTAFRHAIADLHAGRAAAAAGDLATALTHFDAAASGVPGCARAQEEASRLRGLLRERQAADDRRRALLLEANEAVGRSDWLQVLILTEEVLSSDGHHQEAGALRQRATAALAAEERQRRERSEQAAARARQLSRQGRFVDAEAALAEGLRANPQDPTLGELADSIRAARIEAERASARERRSAEVIASARKAFASGARDEALAALRAFLRQEPDSPSAAAALRELDAEAQMLAAAEQRRARAAELATESDTLLRAGEADKALRMAQEALRLQDDDQLARKVQGLATARIRELAAARERAERAEQLLQRAREQLQRGKHAGAREQAQAAATLMPSDERVQSLLTAIDEAEWRAREDERLEAEARQRAKAAAPVIARARAAEAARDYARASWLSENALALDPDCAEARQIMERAQAALAAQPELADETVRDVGAKAVDAEDTVTLVNPKSTWSRLAGALKNWMPIGRREGA